MEGVGHEPFVMNHVALVFMACCLYATYYLLYIAKKPTIACKGENFLRFLDQHVPVSREKFWPTWWCFDPRLQTILRNFVQPHADVNYESEFLKTPDGGEIQLDWEHNHENSPFPIDTRPTVLLMPGLTGHSRENYITNKVKDATALGYRSVVFVYRGLGKSTLRTPRTYCAANVEDTTFVIDYVKAKFPHAPLMGAGISLGGVKILNYLAKTREEAKLEAAIVISVGWDIFAAVKSLSTTVNYWLFNRTFTMYLVDFFQQNIKMFQGFVGMDPDHVLESQCIQEFDERFTAKMFGYSSLHHYYTEASPGLKIHNITKPVLCLNAADDPLQPGHAVPIDKAEESDKVAIVMTSHGGHIGFMEGTFPRNQNYMNRWFIQFTSAVFSQGLKDL